MADALGIKRGLGRLGLLALLGLWASAAGGCAVMPFALTSAASLAVPKTVSLAWSGVKAAHQSAFLASDERDMNTIVRDNLMTVNAQNALYPVPGGRELYVHAYNGDIFIAGVAENDAARDQAILAMRGVKGVDEVKGLIRLRDEAEPGQSVRDGHLENVARLELSRHILHKNSGVDVKAVHGELCLIGMVGTPAEALDLIQYVESTTGAHARSMLVIRDTCGPGRMESNQHYLLATREETLGPRPHAPQLAETRPANLPEPPRPAIAARADDSGDSPAQKAQWQKVRQKYRDKIQALARREANPEARQELAGLAEQVAQDRDISITDRLSVAAAQVKTQGARQKIKALLSVL